MNKVTAHHISILSFSPLLSTLMAILILATVFIAIGASAKGAELLSVEKEIYELENKGRELSAKIIEKNSLSKAYEEAQTLGMAKPSQILYLGSEATVAKLP